MPVETINTQITPSLHPANVESIEDYDDTTAGAVAPVLEAFRTAYQGLDDIYKARAAADKNPVLNDAARLLQVAAFAEKHQNTITRRFDGAREKLLTAIKAIDSSLNEPLKLRAERPGVAGEVRSFVKALSTEQREKWFNERQRAGDMESLEHVLGAPPFLSGLSDDERTVRTKFYHELRKPVEAKRLKVMRAALELVETRGPLVLTQVEEAIGARWAKVNKLRSATSEAERAFLVRDKSAAA